MQTTTLRSSPNFLLRPGLLKWSTSRIWGVYEIVPRGQIDECGGKLIDTRWIDTNKADEVNPEYRSRLVGREFKAGKDNSLYASNPTLESLRLIVSWAATVKKNDIGHAHELMINDARRAHLFTLRLLEICLLRFLTRILVRGPGW